MLSTAKKKPTRLSQTLLDEDQHNAIDRLYGHDETFLVAGMGAGKTVISLTAINELLRDGVLDRVLVFAPLKVVNEVWRQEADKWRHTHRLNIKVCAGTPAQRGAIVDSMLGERGVMLINFELMAWFFSTYKSGFDGLLIDELSKLKAGGKGFKKMRNCLGSFKWLAGLTGTPVAEDFEGLFYQVFALDKGDRLGKRKDSFLNTYFDGDYNGYDWTLKPDGAERIVKAISDLVYTVPDYRHTLPDLCSMTAFVSLPPEAALVYDIFAKTAVLEIEGLPVQSADNAAVLSGKLQQLASGAIYIEDEFGERVGVHSLHDAKMPECVRLVEDIGEPVVITYWYKHELARLEAAFPNAVNLNEKGSIDKWNAGEVDILLVQPMSCSHGLQLQFGGRNLIWFAPVWSRDIHEQMIARLWRKGQTRPVRVWEIITVGTVDELIVDRVNGKAMFDELFHGLLK